MRFSNKCKMKGYENIENISYIEENVPKLKKENCESIIYCNTNDEAEIAVSKTFNNYLF